MNAEYLLEAIGRLDDDLIQEAERYRRPKAHYGRWMGLAACFAVVILLGYGAAHLRMGGMSSGPAPSFAGGGNGGAPASGNSAPSAPEGEGDSACLFDQNAPGEFALSPGGNGFAGSSAANAEEPTKSGRWDEPAGSGEPFWVSVRLDVDRAFCSVFLEARILNELPEGCVELGKLELWSGTEVPDVPYTASEEYAGCPVWLLMEEPETFTFYVGLPEGGYLTPG